MNFLLYILFIHICTIVSIHNSSLISTQVAMKNLIIEKVRKK